MKWVLVVLALLIMSSAAYAAGDQAYLGIFAETKVTKMVGVPEMPEMPELPAGIKLPKGMGGMFGAPSRILTVRLWSPSIAPANASAFIVPPEGLQQGEKLDLDLYRPKSEPGGGSESGPGQFNPDSIKDFTIKMYWGSSETVRPGQPKIIRWDGMPAEQKAAMRKQAQEAQKRSSYFYKPNWTTGYWPTEKQDGVIAKDASLVGTYALTTNYTGSVSIDAPSNVDFLAPIVVTSPDLKNKIDLNKFIPFGWQQVPNALGFHADIVGMEGQNTLVLWNSSEVFDEAMMSSDWGFLQMAEVLNFVKSTVMMKGDSTKFSVPAGIFKNADMAMFSMVGYGPGAALDKAQPLPRIQTKTTLSIMLGGKKMVGMGGGVENMPTGE